jgi:GT2 family glycosyltransferase
MINSKEKIVVIIINWNGRKLLETCLSSLKDNTNYENFKVIVVDNASSDDSISYLQNLSWVKVIPLKKNYGFAIANNIAIKYAIDALNPDYFLLLNNDTKLIEPNWLTTLVDIFQKHNDIGILGSKLLNNDLSLQNIGIFFDKDGFHWPKPTNLSALPILVDVDVILGACFMIRRNVVERIGFLDEGFFPYQFEEADYCVRARKVGFRVCSCRDSTVVHLSKGSIGRTPSESFYLINAKNEVRFMILNFPLDWLPHRFIKEIPKFAKSLLKKRSYAKMPQRYASRGFVRFNAYANVSLSNLRNIVELVEKRLNRNKKVYSKTFL